MRKIKMHKYRDLMEIEGKKEERGRKRDRGDIEQGEKDKHKFWFALLHAELRMTFAHCKHKSNSLQMQRDFFSIKQ